MSLAKEYAGGVIPCSRHHAPGLALGAARDAVGRLLLERDRRQRRQLLAGLGRELVHQSRLAP